MIIDILFGLLMVMAIIKGYSNGLIVAVFSLVALVVGLAAAMKFSTVVAGWMKDSVHVAARWLPLIAFAIVFIAAVILVRMAAKALQKAVEFVLLGWVNRLGGIVFYVLLYIVIFSILLFYAGKMNLLTRHAIDESGTYSYIRPWGPRAINGIGMVVPFFRNMFEELEHFFSNLSDNVSFLQV
jgi:membrane protein required for colicin V production